MNMDDKNRIRWDELRPATWADINAKLEAETHRLKVRFSPDPAVTRYINSLLRFAKHEQTEVMVTESQPLPVVPAAGQGTEQAPEFDAVINYLKILSGLDPVEYEAPVEGVIRYIVRDTPFAWRTRFGVNEQGAFCSIEFVSDRS